MPRMKPIAMVCTLLLLQALMLWCTLPEETTLSVTLYYGITSMVITLTSVYALAPMLTQHDDGDAVLRAQNNLEAVRAAAPAPEAARAPANEDRELLLWGRVRLRNLVSKPELNGKLGRITGVVAESGRYTVTLHDDAGDPTSQTLAVKQDNVEPLAAKSCLVCGRSADANPAGRCGRCRSVHFCSAACQDAGWPSHRKLCRTGDEHEVELLRLQSEGNAALSSGVPSEASRAARLFLDAAGLCEARRSTLVDGDDAPRDVVTAVQDSAPRRPRSSVISGLFEGVDDRGHHSIDAVAALGR